MQPARIEMIENETAKLEKPDMPRCSSWAYPSSARARASSSRWELASGEVAGLMQAPIEGWATATVCRRPRRGVNGPASDQSPAVLLVRSAGGDVGGVVGAGPAAGRRALPEGEAVPGPAAGGGAAPPVRGECRRGGPPRPAPPGPRRRRAGGGRPGPPRRGARRRRADRGLPARAGAALGPPPVSVGRRLTPRALSPLLDASREPGQDPGASVSPARIR